MKASTEAPRSAATPPRAPLAKTAGPAKTALSHPPITRKTAPSMSILARATLGDYTWMMWRKRLRDWRNPRLALARVIGATSLENFDAQGDGQVVVLRHYCLADGMAVYDLGCGCGRTAQALQRAGWQGSYTGADILAPLVRELRRACPDYTAHVHRKLSLLADDASLDMVFHWSVFTHLKPEECLIYMQDTFRALKPGGRLVFSFLELEDPQHAPIFARRAKRIAGGGKEGVLDSFHIRD